MARREFQHKKTPSGQPTGCDKVVSSIIQKNNIEIVLDLPGYNFCLFYRFRATCLSTCVQSCRHAYLIELTGSTAYYKRTRATSMRSTTPPGTSNSTCEDCALLSVIGANETRCIDIRLQGLCRNTHDPAGFSPANQRRIRRPSLGGRSCGMSANLMAAVLAIVVGEVQVRYCVAVAVVVIARLRWCCAVFCNP